MSVTFTAVLLAGGESRRMGKDKAILAIDGMPLWSRQLAMLRELQPRTILVSARARPAWCPPELDVVTDAPPSLGPLSGLAATLARIQTTHLLALAVDLPRMTTDMLRSLCRAAQPGCGVVPVGDHGFEGLCAIYPAEAAPAAAAALANRSLSLQTLIRDLSQRGQFVCLPLQPSERALFRNVNTPTELAAVEIGPREAPEHSHPSVTGI